MKRLLVAVLVASTIMGTLWARGSQEKSGYVFAADATWPPLEFIDESGRLTGFEVELVQAMGNAVGEIFTVKNIPWDTIFAGLANGAYDAVASGVTVTEERKATMDFSNPILNVGQVVIMRSTQAAQFSSIAELNGKKVGVQIGTTGDFALESYPVQRRVYDDIGLAIEDMMNGNIDAVVCDSLIASDFVLANKNYQGKMAVVGQPFTQEDIAIAVKKGNATLLDLIDKGLKALQADGSFDTLKRKWNLL